MKTILLLIFLLVVLFMFSKNELFENANENEDECAKIPEGECNSKLCKDNCKIQHSTTSDKCYCVKRR